MHRLIWRLLAIAMDRETVSRFSSATRNLSHFLDFQYLGRFRRPEVLGKDLIVAGVHPSAEYLMCFARPESFFKNQQIYDLAQKTPKTPKTAPKYRRNDWEVSGLRCVGGWVLRNQRWEHRQLWKQNTAQDIGPQDLDWPGRAQWTRNHVCLLVSFWSCREYCQVFALKRRVISCRIHCLFLFGAISNRVSQLHSSNLLGGMRYSTSFWRICWV